MSVPNPACPMISKVVRLSYSRTSKDLVVTRDSVISSFQSAERRSDFAQKTGEGTRMAKTENLGARALRWWHVPSLQLEEYHRLRCAPSRAPRALA